MSKISQLFENKVHLGHRTSIGSPDMEPYIFGVRGNIHIIDLQETIKKLDEALLAIRQVTLNEGKVVFVGTKYLAQNIVVEQAKRCQMYYVNYRWLGGMLTNHKTIRQSVKKLIQLESAYEKTKFEYMVKKERLKVLREMTRLEDNFSGVKTMKGLPDLLVVIDVGYESIAVQEAKKLGIPVIGLVDTNNTPSHVTYPIPANDDASQSIEYFCKVFADEILMAQSEVAARKKSMSDKKPSVTYREASAEEASAVPAESPKAVLKQSSASKDSKTVVAKSPKAPKKPAAASKSDD
tara:strand:- start:374 stop:1255 length:882 start_codon:yes stop_codon:yes gene_type:complete